MKRALAERAKQSALPNGVGVQEKSLPVTDTPGSHGTKSSAPVVAPMSNASTGSSNAAPEKIQSNASTRPSHNASKIQVKKSTTNLSIGTKTTTTTTPAKASRSPRPHGVSSSPRPKKRARESLIKLEEDDEDDSGATSFYLRHQNHALASELRSVKYQLVRLEREREHRRTQCMHAVRSLNVLYSKWTKVEAAIEKRSLSVNPLQELPESDAPLSTGSGKSVEWIDALINSLARIGKRTLNENGDIIENSKKDLSDQNSMEIEDEETIPGGDDQGSKCMQNFNDITDLAENFSDRVGVLHSWIMTTLQNLDKSKISLQSEFKNASWSPPPLLELENQLSLAEAENLTLQEHIKELTRSRDEMVESDRRVRRGLYRLAAGRVNLKEVLKAIATADEDKESAAAWMESSAANPSSSGSSSLLSKSSVTIDKTESGNGENKNTVSSKEIEELKKQVADLKSIASSRDEQIKKLVAEKENQSKRINSLVLKKEEPKSHNLKDEDVERSDLYLDLTAKLKAATRNLEEINEQSLAVRKEWATAIADAELSKKALEDMQSNFSKRFDELLGGMSHNRQTMTEDLNSSGIRTAKEISVLQHKLTQALENVRQALTTRKTLEEAISMNNSLQAKVDEFKTKYNTLQAEKAARANGSCNTQLSGSNSTPSKDAHSSSKPKSTPIEKGDRSIDKLQREYKRARKELAAIAASKDAAKAKLERIEKEKDFLSQMNSRLLKQASEKDEINAKSLSTILHLKQLTEQITKEKENLEQQVKSAGQLALAARLAANARNRVAEEFANEEKALRGQLKEFEEKCSVLSQEKEFAEGKLLQEKARMSGLVNEARKAKERCEELATESSKAATERQKIIEMLAIANREASEAKSLSKKLANSKGGGLVSGFTAEQLNTQVSHLKNRLACPVCNVRDKKCILLRCRHMFCKQCVDENVKNRSRKCPACGGRFDTKDIADVWL